jgi:hypothetical protein
MKICVPHVMSRESFTFGLLSASVVVLSTCSFSTSLAASAGPADGPSSQMTGYQPSISDLMIGTIQPRHERIWQAEQAGDWDFAAYELGNLRGAFGRLGRAHPTEHNTSLPEMIASVTDQPFNHLKAAIEAKDDIAFAKAYDELGDGCNSCHQALNHGAVVIGRPDGPSHSDLAFRKAAP